MPGEHGTDTMFTADLEEGLQSLEKLLELGLEATGQIQFLSDGKYSFQWITADVTSESLPLARANHHRIKGVSERDFQLAKQSLN